MSWTLQLDLAFNNVKRKDWYFVLDLVFRTELGCVRLTIYPSMSTRDLICSPAMKLSLSNANPSIRKPSTSAATLTISSTKKVAIHKLNKNNGRKKNRHQSRRQFCFNPPWDSISSFSTCPEPEPVWHLSQKKFIEGFPNSSGSFPVKYLVKYSNANNL